MSAWHDDLENADYDAGLDYANERAAEMAGRSRGKMSQTKLERELQASVVSLAKRNAEPREVVVHEPGGLQFTEQQEEMIRAHFSTGATKSEFEVLMAIAKARKLNPLLKQVYFVKRRDKKLGKDVWSVQVSIDGLRAIAERTGAYDGQDEPEFEYNEQKEIILARVRVYKKGVSRPFVGVARWDEYVQTFDGKPTKFWQDMPYTMLGKCAEALAIRKAFPEDSGGLYVAEEMMQADADARPGQLNRHEPGYQRQQEDERRTPDISPHGVDDDLSDSERSAISDPPELMRLLTSAHAMLDQGMWSAARSRIGMKGGDPGEFGPKFSAAKNAGNLSADYSRALGKLWGQLDRQIAKLEAADLAKPADVVSTLTDEPDDGDNYDRSQ